MNFKDLTKFINNIGKTYNIPCYDISIYYDHVNVFRSKRNLFRSMGRNLYFMQSGTKIMTCVALMRLVQAYKISLNDKLCQYLTDFPEDITVRTMISEYSRISDTEEKVFNFRNIRKLIEVVSGVPFEEFVASQITGPLKMKSTSFNLTSKSKKHIAKQYRFDENSESFVAHEADVEAIAKKKDGCVLTTVDDYAKFCEAMCSGGVSQNGYRLLSKESVDILINELIYKETEKEDAFVSVGRHGGLVLIDTKKKITIVYAQYVKDMLLEQFEMYPTLRKLVYECIGADTWSMGYNVLP
ncbi:MAG: beta-lactamase family protein [Tyzzerella sp.]|nr:beta-lactamase family protein [Tyzzerella sp.]